MKKIIGNYSIDEREREREFRRARESAPSGSIDKRQLINVGPSAMRSPRRASPRDNRNDSPRDSM